VKGTSFHHQDLIIITKVRGVRMSKKRSVPKLIQFRSKDASKLAELFNSFDKEGLWPGGFTGGVPYTAQRVLDSFPVNVKNLGIFISTCQGKFTGICTLHPHFEDSEAAYIGVLGVHPDYLGQGHGKALILRSLSTAAENKLRRVDLGTWAGNLRAVPLYKKCGMFWVPETSVEMQDYIPGIVNFPIAKDFFRKYDWYTSQIRELKLVPDESKLEEMEVFAYEFAKDEDRLEVWVDRYGRGILGIDRRLDGDQIRIICQLNDHKIIAGLEHRLTVEIKNNTKSSLKGAIFLFAFKGLDFTAQPQQSFSVEREATIKLTAKFVASPETEILETNRKQKSIKVNLIINGEMIPLEIGMRLLPLLEFKTFPENIAIKPGTAGSIQINTFNNSKKHFKGNLFIIDEDNKLSFSKTVMPIEISPKSHSGFTLNMEIEKDQSTSALPMAIFSEGTIEGVKVKTKTKLTHIKCLKLGGIVTSVEETEQGRAIIVENSSLMASIRLRGALLEITYKNSTFGSQKVWTYGTFGVGPPFGFVKPIDYEYEIHRTPESLELSLSGWHPDRPGIKMVRVLRFYPEAPIIKERIKIVNLHTDIAYNVNVRITGRGGPQFFYTMVVPLKETVKHEMIGFPVSEADLPTDPENFRESWICFQNQAQGFCLGRIWSKEKLSKIRIGEQSLFSPEYVLGQIKPGESSSTSELYYVVERGSWEAIHRKWELLIKRKLIAEERIIKAKPLLDVRLAENVFYDNKKLETQLMIVNLRNKEVSGKIIFTPPFNWKVTPSQISFKKVAAENKFTANLSIVPPPKAELGIHNGTISFSSEKREIQYPLNFCILSKTSKHSVEIVPDKDQKKVIYKVSNGLLHFKTSAEFAGCLYFLGKNGTNQLGTSFPKIGTQVFLQNYTGGIRALYLDGFDFQKSKTHAELYKAEISEEGFWKGIEFSFNSKQQEEIKGLQGSISYLTLPFSNIIRITRRFKNLTSASFKFGSCLWVSPAVGGSFENNEVIFPRDNKVYWFKRTEGVSISGVQPERGWLLVKNRKKQMGLGIIVGNTDLSTILSLDLGNTLLELFILSKIQLQAEESCKLEDYVVLNSGDHESLDELSGILRN
jgi:GNAT superfamily N-acetyltransferase